jgi:hypothetical protein
MASSMARGGRRRRVLNEEARAAAGVAASLSMVSHDGVEAPRYGEQAGIEHHPQISDYVPRRKRAVLAALAGGAIVAAATLTLAHGAEAIASVLPGVAAADVEGLAHRAAAWISALALLAIAGLARLTYTLRRHRVDDVRGKYRVWKWVTAGALALSFNAVVGVHGVVASVAVSATGWSLTAAAAEWWLAPLALLGAWIMVRVVRETAESRSSVAMILGAVGCFGIAAAGTLGWKPAALGGWSDALTTSAPIVGLALALAGMTWFARYVVLDVQGLIEHAPKPAKPRRPLADESADTTDAESKPGIAVAPPAPPRREPAPAPAAAAPWDDNDEDDADADADRYLSKSERKRLRKQQQRRAA